MKKNIVIILLIVLMVGLGCIMGYKIINQTNNKKKLTLQIEDLNKKLEEFEEKNEFLRIENQTLKTMNSDQLAELERKEKENSDMLLELEDTKNNIKKRTSLINSFRSTGNYMADNVFLFFDDLSYVDSINFKIATAAGSVEGKYIGINGSYKVPVILDKDQNKGVVSYNIDQPFKIYKSDGTFYSENSEFSGFTTLSLYEIEIQYNDGRTETINFNIAVG